MFRAEWRLGDELKEKGKKAFANENYSKTIRYFEKYIHEYEAEIKENFNQQSSIISSLVLGKHYLSINYGQELNINLDTERDKIFSDYCIDYINDYFLQLKNYLNQKKDILNMLLVSYYNLIKDGIYKKNEIKKFEGYREKYFEIARWFKKEELLKSWSEAKLENLIRYNLEIAMVKITEKDKIKLDKLENEFKEELRSVFGKFIAIFCPIFSTKVFIKQLLVKINSERNNFQRTGWYNYQYIKNTNWLIDFFLEITENSQNYNEARASMMNLKADIIYFFGENQGERGKKEHEAIKWLEKSQVEFTSNRFTENRIEELYRNMTITEQINKFRHDTTNKISYLRDNLNKIIKKDYSPQELKTKLAKLGNKVEEIETLFRLTKKEAAKFEMCNIKNLCQEAIADFPKLDQECLTFIGQPRKIELDRNYFLMTLQNLIENSFEAYQRAGIKPGEKPVEIEFNYKNLECKVKDQAGGIPDNLQTDNKLFEPYTSSEGTYQDVGMGLAEVAAAIELQTGEIDYQTDNQGTEFIITLQDDKF